MASRHRRAVFLIPAQPVENHHWSPAVDIYQGTDGWLLKFDLAGVRQEDIAVQVQGCRVAVQGVRRDLVLEEGYRYHSMEISYSRFSRVIQLPCDWENTAYQMEFRDGYLIVRVLTERKDHE